MRFDWYQFLLLARELLNMRTLRSLRAALQRTAISRAYYAAFSTARKYLREVEGVNTIRQDAHQFVINYFLNSTDSDYFDIGEQLKTLLTARNKADYDEVFVGLQNQAQKMVALADDTIRAINGL